MLIQFRLKRLEPALQTPPELAARRLFQSLFSSFSDTLFFRLLLIGQVMRSLWCLACLVFARHTAGASNTLSPPESATSQSPPTPQSTACGDIVNDQLGTSLS